MKYSQANHDVPPVVSLTSLAIFPSFDVNRSQTAQEFYPLVLSLFSLSLAGNALVTGLIIFKILIVFREIQGLESRVGLGPRDIFPVISILIESGVITFVVQLMQTFMYKFYITAYPILSGVIVQLYVRGFTVNF